MKFFTKRWYWIATILAVFLIILIPNRVTFSAPMDRTFQIQAAQFEYTPSIIRVNPGDRVTFELTATDVVHGLSIDGYNLETTSDPGQTTRLTFISDRQGSFRFRCTVTCGNMHPFMIGKLQVGRNDLLWRGVLLAGLAVLAGIWGLKK